MQNNETIIKQSNVESNHSRQRDAQWNRFGLKVGIALVRLTGCTLSHHRRRKSKSWQMDR